jgi:hypothetical protein
VHQGIFVHDAVMHYTWPVAKAPGDFEDFVYWNFSGMVPGTGHSGDAGEPPRWRASSFVAVSGLVFDGLTDPTFHVAFKARKGQSANAAYVHTQSLATMGAGVTDGIYLRMGPGMPPIATVVETGMDGALIDPAAIDAATGAHLPITDMGIERDGFRGNSLAISVSMGAEETGWAGIYLTIVPNARAR